MQNEESKLVDDGKRWRMTRQRTRAATEHTCAFLLASDKGKARQGKVFKVKASRSRSGICRAAANPLYLELHSLAKG
ncbi:hypothetical protein M419DRAFT_121972 [Trichoderma reesei RUT C-30]|uniref:Uncharacterized protein n=1 Tax=Hypocrea jecorina (strain ATCC 56765 / BCRC 32924 / NRRL 11460 / Rut C-30) TaxID=1344414 RepID=A0A024SI21_HYPJR|nr:hypothetical protein M419DRAFT_121972 [Trichoderma reesei RUT C-30]